MSHSLPLLFARFRTLACGLLLTGLTLLAQATQPLALDDRTPEVQAWPALTMLADPSRTLALDDVVARREQFQAPAGARGSLGLRRDAVWLHLPLSVAAASDGRWILDLDYAVLNRIDVYLVTAHAPARHWVLGNLQPRAERPMTGRSHAVPLDLAPGSVVEIFLRVETAGAMILPITLSKAPAFHARAVNEQMLQGLLIGLGLFLVLYSLAQWLSVREPMFPKYALLTSGSLLFSVAQFGLGAQYVWGEQLWFERHVPGLAALLASTGTFLFVEEVLASDSPRRWFSRLMHVGAAALLCVAAAFALDLIDVRTVSLVVGTLGLAPALLGLPGAIARLRRGDSVGGYFLTAWLAYFASTWVMVGLIEGRLPANAWTLHSFQIGATLDMLLFLRVIALRLAGIHSEAQHAARERETLHSLAHTDPLTGLPNRRGLVAQIDSRLAHARPERLLALYMLDLDGFKQINDRHGHDTGDQLLVAVAARLREGLREQDLIARLGGDEFVVVADDLRGAAQAEAVGNHLLQAFAAPFEVAGQPCTVGLTAGYVLAPLDGRDARELLKAADSAMYAGKQDGKNRVRRAEPAHAG